MRRIIHACVPAMVLLLAAVAVVPSTPAQETTVLKLDCGTGYPLWLWAEGAGASCDQQGGLAVCKDLQGDDVARGSCDTGCEMVRIDNVAGCYRGNGIPDTTKPNFTLLCYGKKIDLKGVPGDKCKYHEFDKEGNPTGAKCSRVDENGTEIVSAEANCDVGCVQDRPPGNCRVR